MDPWSEATTQAVEAVSPAIVHVAVKDSDEDGLSVGSGLVLDRHHVLVNTQTVEDADSVKVATQDGQRFSAEILGSDPLYYLAVLRLSDELTIDEIPFGVASEVKEGQMVLAVGNPMGTRPTVSFGVVSSANRTIYRPDGVPIDGIIVTDAAIHPGNSGGALTSLEGEIVAMNGIPWAHGLSLAIQTGVFRRVAHQIISQGRATHPWIGIEGQAEVIDQVLVNLFSLPADRGVVVTNVMPNGPAEKAGLHEFDMIVRLEEQPLSGIGSLRKVLSSLQPGETASLKVLRGSELVDIPIHIEEIPRHQLGNNS